ncbi:MAG: YfhO family protein, partial [Deltaproteobacteria bacterium]|nr:YfhO family protein [Deltaproteobacteria bacterium]
LVFRYLHLFVHTRRLLFAFAAGFVQGIQILGGFPQISFYTILGGRGFLCFHGVLSLKVHQWGDVSRMAFGAIVVLLVGFGLAAVQVAPTLEFSRLSTRGEGLNYAMATYESLDPKELLAFLIPDIFGSAVDQTYWKSRDAWHFWESCGYVGILPRWLAFVRTGEPSLRRVRAFFLLLIGVALVLALGKYNPLYPWIYRLPGFSSFRLPVQIIFLYIFGIAVVSGIGLDQLQRDSWKWNRGFIPFMALVGGLLAVFVIGLHVDPFRFFFNLFRAFSEGPVTHANLSALYGRVGHSVHAAALLFFAALALLIASRRIPPGSRAIPLAVFALVTVDLLSFGVQFVKTQPLTTHPEKAALLSRLSGTPVQGRVVTMDPRFRTNDGLQYRFPSVLGYDPLMLKRYADYLLSSQEYPFNQHVVNLYGIHDPGAKLLKLLNVRQVVTEGRLLSIDPEVPYANFVRRAFVKPQEEVLAYLKSDLYDPKDSVVFEETGTAHGPPGPLDSEALVASCAVTGYGSDRITLKAQSNSAGYLVLSEVFYPGWTVTVDGRKGDIMRGNYLFRVIPLERGEHEVTLCFVSWPFRVGGMISLATLISSAFVLLLIRRRGRSAQS